MLKESQLEGLYQQTHQLKDPDTVQRDYSCVETSTSVLSEAGSMQRVLSVCH